MDNTKGSTTGEYHEAEFDRGAQVEVIVPTNRKTVITIKRTFNDKVLVHVRWSGHSRLQSPRPATKISALTQPSSQGSLQEIPPPLIFDDSFSSASSSSSDQSQVSTTVPSSLLHNCSAEQTRGQTELQGNVITSHSSYGSLRGVISEPRKKPRSTRHGRTLQRSTSQMIFSREWDVLMARQAADEERLRQELEEYKMVEEEDLAIVEPLNAQYHLLERTDTEIINEDFGDSFQAGEALRMLKPIELTTSLEKRATEILE